MAPVLGALIRGQSNRCDTYVEPFAGGAGAALRLLYDEYVDKIVLNDLDRGIAAMWRAIFNQNEEFISLLTKTPVTMGSWQKQRAIFQGASRPDDLELGFATFFLNRTNRSGILNARPIGGLDQSGPWKIDARFNKEDLAARISMLGRFRTRVEVLEEDGVDVVGAYLRDKKAFIYVDPPYIDKGSDLYLDTLEWADHRRLARELQRRTGQWMLTYDHDLRVPKELYPGRRFVTFNIPHTAAKQHIGKEFAVFSDALDLAAVRQLGRLYIYN